MIQRKLVREKGKERERNILKGCDREMEIKMKKERSLEEKMTLSEREKEREK